MDTILLSALFLVVAIIYSSVGMGGGSSYTAVLALAAVPAVSIPPIALSLNIIVASIALWSFIGENFFDGKLALPLVVTSVPASILGASLPLQSETILWILALALGAAAVVLWSKGRLIQLANLSNPMEVAVGLILGSLLGLLAGITGIGGGVFLVPIIIVLGLAHEKKAAATGALFVLLNSMAGLGTHLLRGNIPLTYVLPLAVSVTIGGFLGSQYGARMAPKIWIRRTVSFLLMIVSVRLILSLTELTIL